MLTRLRRELIAITMLLVGLVLLVVLGSSLASSALTQRAITRGTLERAISLDSPDPQLGDTTGEQSADVMLAITVDVSDSGMVLQGVSSTSLQVPAQTLHDVIVEALESPSDTGESDRYPISWMRAQTYDGWRVALVDTYTRDAALRAQALSSLVIFAVSMALLFVVSYLLSGLALRPVEHAWEAQRRFVSDASHELKTPLAVIIANAQILEEEPALPVGARRWVESTSDEARHMKELVEDLLTLARADEQADSGAAGAARAETDLTELVSGCALEFDAVAYERGCSISCDLEKDVRATVNASQVRQVVRTLLDNATKYAPAGSVVRVACRREGRRACLSVNNQGDAISPEDLPHLFDRFYRTDSARERQSTGGFGLGLAIAKSLVESNGGKISATSTEQAGTTFTVTL